MLISGLDYGGAEQVVFDLSAGLVREGHIVEVCCMLDRAARAESFREAGISLHLLNMHPKWWHWKNLASIRQTHKILMQHRIDILHAHMMHAIVLAVCLKMLSWQRRIVFTRHNVVGAFTYLERFMFRLSRVFRYADIVFSPTELKALDVKNGVSIPNGINLAPAVQLPKNYKFTFLTVGMFREQKNYIVLPEVASDMVLSGFTDFEIWMCGEGETLQETQLLVEKFKVSQYFRFWGLQPFPGTFYMQAHAFLLPSLYEGLPLAVLEAGFYGLPIITTPVGVLPDYFDENQMYFTSVDAMAKTLVHVAEHQSEAAEKARRLQHTIQEEFLADRMIARHINLYDQCIN